MKTYEKAMWASLLALLALSLGAVILTRGWSDYRERLRAIRLASKSASNLVDTHPLDTAQQVAPLAVTHIEEDYAGQALRLGDLSVDLAFSAAMHDAAENPAPLTPKTRELAARVQSGTSAVAADQSRIAVFTAAMARAKGSAKDDLQNLIGIAQAQLALDQDDLEDAQQDLIRSGGDKQATIQQLLDQRKAAGSQNAAAQVGPPAGSAPSTEITQSRSIAAETRAWMSLRAKEKLLLQAQADALGRANTLTVAHETLEKQMDAGNTPAQDATPEADTPLSRLRQQTEDKKNLSDVDKRIATEQQLAAVYSGWADLVNARAKGFLHEIFVSIFWVLLIGVLVLAANELIQRLFAGVALERREMHTMRALILFALQVLGLLAILLVIFGIPTNLATVLALAGAGLTVAMKDFIVGFFGWFVLMGKDGIRAGDWVEINGVGGEVLKVGLLHTVLLETGSWTDAGHPTGRQVSFVNSFAIEGHYFNFSTSGQWLWDEIEAQVPENADPYATGEALQKIAAEETAANAKLAETEWNSLTPSSEKHALSATPSLSVRPTATGVNIVLRYLTRANERHEVRARLYRAAVDLLRKKQVPELAPPTTGRKPAAGRT
jgi:small-conductance mechanosensitive channel